MRRKGISLRKTIQVENMELTPKLIDVFEFAKKMELDGKEMYLAEIGNTVNPGIKNILHMLVKAEENHYEIFSAMQAKKKKEVIHTDFGKIKNIFEQMAEKGETLFGIESHRDFYMKALKIEEETEEFYRTNAERCDDEEVKQVLKEIADEEHRHAVLLNAFVEMTQNPVQWVENAEFNHLDDY